MSLTCSFCLCHCSSISASPSLVSCPWGTVSAKAICHSLSFYRTQLTAAGGEMGWGRRELRSYSLDARDLFLLELLRVLCARVIEDEKWLSNVKHDELVRSRKVKWIWSWDPSLLKFCLEEVWYQLQNCGAYMYGKPASRPHAASSLEMIFHGETFFGFTYMSIHLHRHTWPHNL